MNSINISVINWVDLLFAALVLLFAISGNRSGVLHAVVRMFAMLFAAGIAAVSARLLAPVLTASFQPMVAEAIQEQLVTALNSGEGMLGALGGLVAGSSEELLGTISGQVASSLLGALEGMLFRIMIFTLVFLLVMLIWTALSGTLRVVALLPPVRALDRLLGTICGGVLGVVVAVICLYIANHFGIVTTQTIQSSFIFGKLIKFLPIFL